MDYALFFLFCFLKNFFLFRDKINFKIELILILIDFNTNIDDIGNCFMKNKVDKRELMRKLYLF